MPQSEPTSKTKSSDLSDQLNNLPFDGVNDDLNDKRLKHHETVTKFLLRQGVLFFLCILGAVVLVIYFWHLLMPEWLRWLSKADLEEIRGLVISIVSGMAITLAVDMIGKKH